MFFHRIRARSECLLLLLLFAIGLGVVNRAISHEEEIKDVQIGKKIT